MYNDEEEKIAKEAIHRNISEAKERAQQYRIAAYLLRLLAIIFIPPSAITMTKNFGMALPFVAVAVILFVVASMVTDKAEDLEEEFHFIAYRPHGFMKIITIVICILLSVRTCSSALMKNYGDEILENAKEQLAQNR